MQILIPMAGMGSRFVNEGYSLPKPLLPISGRPMFIEATKYLPRGDSYYFVVQNDHIRDFHLREVISKAVPNSNIIGISGVTDGQARTCLIAHTELNLQEELIIGACDNGLLYNQLELTGVMEKADAIVFSFSNHSVVLEKPEAYGWVVCDESGLISRVSVKVPISKDPIQDSAIVGTFWFKSAELFIDAASEMIARDTKVNGEFYVDECINNLIGMGKKVFNFKIDAYLGWGTPNDYEAFNYWQSFFSNN